MKKYIELVCFLSIAPLLWYGSWVFVEKQIPETPSVQETQNSSDVMSKRGQFGDQFGTVNALFSGLAFVALIYTIRQQQKEITDNQKEAYAQRFEASFFNMLSQHNDMVSHFDVMHNDGVSIQSFQTKEVFRSFVSQFKILLVNNMVHKSSHSFSEYAVYVDQAYDKFYKDYAIFMGSYYRSLYRLFCFLDESKIENKRMYSDIIRSQFTDDEIELLFFNGLSEKGINFKKFIEKYCLLDNLPETNLIGVPTSLYSESAYKDQFCNVCGKRSYS